MSRRTKSNKKGGKAKRARRKEPAAQESATPRLQRWFPDAPTLHLQPLKDAWPHMLLVFVALVVLYAITAPRTVVLEDDGEFIMAAYYLGVAHPPGYPLFVLLAHPFTWLPFGSVAFRIHLASGAFAALACALIWWIVRGLIPRRAPAYVAALSLGVSQAFWSQAVIAEVYSLNVLLFVSMLAVCFSYVDSRKPALLPALALLLGLAFSNHWPLVVLSLPCLLVVLLPAHRSVLRQLRRAVPWALLLFAVGLAPYVWMFLRSRTATELTFSGAMETWSDLVYYVGRGPYADSSATAGWHDRLLFGGFLLRESIAQFTILGAAFAALGLVTRVRSWNLTLTLALWVGVVTTPLGLVLLRNVDFDLASRAITEVYPLVSYSMLAICVAIGFDRVVRLAPPGRWAGRVATLGLGGLVVGVPLVANARHDDRRGYDLARDYATTLLSSFDRDATVFVQHDFATFPMEYLHFVEGVRPDLRLLHNGGLTMALDGRLFNERVDPATRLGSEARMEQLVSYVQSTDRPVYFLQNAPSSISDFDYGFYKKIDRSSEDQTTWMADDDLLAFFRRVLDMPADDEVTLWTRDFLVRQMTPVLTALVEVPPVSQDLVARYGADLEAACRYLPGILARVQVWERRGGGTPEERLRWMGKAEDMKKDAVSKAQLGQIYLHKGRALRDLGRIDEARAAFERSIALFPAASNEAFEDVVRLNDGGPA